MKYKKLAAVFAGFSLAAVAGVAVNAWGPSRPGLTYPNAANKPTFNSFVNNPYYGDERAFFDTKDAANTQNGGFFRPN